MSTETPSTPTPPSPQTNGTGLVLDETEGGTTVWTDPRTSKQYVPYSRFKAVLDEQKRLKETTGAPVDAEALKAQVRAEVEAQYKPRLLALEAQAGLLRAGLIHDEDAAEEVMQRYGRVQPGEDGKKPDLQTWLLAQKEAKARWIKALLPDGSEATPAPSAAAPAAEQQPEGTKTPKTPTSQPNGGTVQTPTAPAKGKLWDRLESMSYAERVANWEQLRIEGQAAGIDIGEKPGKK